MKDIARLKKKTDDHYLAMARLEWEAGIYYDDFAGIHIPPKCLMGAFKAAAKKDKMGSTLNALIIDAPIGVPLTPYEGMTPADLWHIETDDGKKVHVHREAVVVMRARIIRTRAWFPKWELKFRVYVETDIMTVEEMTKYIEVAGFQCGIGEMRPQKAVGTCGRFELSDIYEV